MKEYRVNSGQYMVSRRGPSGINYHFKNDSYTRVVNKEDIEYFSNQDTRFISKTADKVDNAKKAVKETVKKATGRGKKKADDKVEEES